MKQLCIALALLAVGLPAVAQETAGKPPLTDENDRISYALGQLMAQGMYADMFELNFDLFVEGVKDALDEKPARMPENDMAEAVGILRDRVQAKAREERAKAQAELDAKAEENQTAGPAYLAENAKKEGVKVTASGLQYEVIEPGEGAPPAPEDTVMVHYTGTFIDGTQFDSSKGGQPFTLTPPWRVIQGWIEAVQLMPKGAKYIVTIPPELGYGEQGRPGMPGNSVLVFEMEVVDIRRAVQVQ